MRLDFGFNGCQSPPYVGLCSSYPWGLVVDRESWLVWVVLALPPAAACGDDDNGGGPSSRLDAAVSRIQQRSCECLGDFLELTQLCSEDAGRRAAGSDYCLGLTLDEFQGRYPNVVECHVSNQEALAACTENASCNAREQALCQASLQDCPALPADMATFMEQCEPTWMCRNFLPIDASQRCDGNIDCLDRSDEDNCQ